VQALRLPSLHLYYIVVLWGWLLHKYQAIETDSFF